MTWSICLSDPDDGSLAVAVATCAFAVGASCPFVRSGVGAVSTQSITNRYLGPAVLDGMARGLSPEAAITGALASDEGRHLRQIHAVDTHGRAAAWTGRHCVAWCGDAAAPHVSVAGNMLAGPEVVAATMDAITSSSGPLPDRLAAAMRAGEAAGGDRRGKQSAAMLVTTTEDFPDVNLRVDDHSDPLGEIARLVTLWRRDAAPRLQTAPRRAEPAGLIDLDVIEAGWKRRGLSLRFPR